MKIEIDTKNNLNINIGCIIITKDGSMFLVTKNELDPPCKCSESMGKGYVLISLNRMSAWSVFPTIEDIVEDLLITKIIQPDNILLKEIK